MYLISAVFFRLRSGNFKYTFFPNALWASEVSRTKPRTKTSQKPRQAKNQDKPRQKLMPGGPLDNPQHSGTGMGSVGKLGVPGLDTVSIMAMSSAFSAVFDISLL